MPTGGAGTARPCTDGRTSQLDYCHLQVQDSASDDADMCATDIDQDMESLQASSAYAAVPKSVCGGVQPWWMRQAESGLTSMPTRNPMPNYSAEFVQAHNPVRREAAVRLRPARVPCYLNLLCEPSPILILSSAVIAAAPIGVSAHVAGGWVL
jgi:hypothetical protein